MSASARTQNRGCAAVVGANIKLRRSLMKMKQSELAEHFRVSVSTISRIELGEVDPTMHQLDVACLIFDCTPNDLFGYKTP